MENKPIVIERTFDAPVSLVWKAITDRDEMEKWYFNLADFKPEKGFKFDFKGGPDGREYLHLCEVTEVVPEKKLTYSWKYKGYSGISYVTFELTDKKDKTFLKFTHEGLSSFPHDNPDFAKKNFEGGWDHFINKALPAHVDSTK